MDELGFEKDFRTEIHKYRRDRSTIKHGILSKLGHSKVKKNDWKKRYCVLKDTGEMFYFKTLLNFENTENPASKELVLPSKFKLSDVKPAGMIHLVPLPDYLSEQLATHTQLRESKRGGAKKGVLNENEQDDEPDELFVPSGSSKTTLFAAQQNEEEDVVDDTPLDMTPMGMPTTASPASSSTLSSPTTSTEAEPNTTSDTGDSSTSTKPTQFAHETEMLVDKDPAAIKVEKHDEFNIGSSTTPNVITLTMHSGRVYTFSSATSEIMISWIRSIDTAQWIDVAAKKQKYRRLGELKGFLKKHCIKQNEKYLASLSDSRQSVELPSATTSTSRSFKPQKGVSRLVTLKRRGQARRASKTASKGDAGNSFYTFDCVDEADVIMDPFVQIASIQYGSSDSKDEAQKQDIEAPTDVVKNAGMVKMIDNNFVWDQTMFDLKEKLGEGSYGSVFLATLKINPLMEFAIKIMDISDPEAEEDARNEYDILKHIHHTAIINYYGVCLNEKVHELWIIMELARTGSVMDLIHTLESPLHEAEIAYIAKTTLEALVYLHEDRRIIHRDLKCGNVLVTPDGHTKLADFGVSKLFGEEINKTTSLIGTAHWVSPEIWAESSVGYSFPADIWSLGITVYEMAVGLPPHAETTPANIYLKLMQMGPPQLPEDDIELPFVQMAMEDIEELVEQGAVDPDSTNAPFGGKKVVKISKAKFRQLISGKRDGTGFGGPPTFEAGEPEPGAVILGTAWRHDAARILGVDLSQPNLNPVKVPSRWSLSLRGFLAHCLTMNPNKRPTAARLLTHPFVRFAPGPEVCIPRIKKYVSAKQLASERAKQEAKTPAAPTFDEYDEYDADGD